VAPPIEADLVVSDSSVLLTCADGSRDQHGRRSVGSIASGALAAFHGRIVWVGPDGALGENVRLVPGGEAVDAAGHLVMPGLVECHTHLAWAGDRADEFQLRVAGASYQQLAEAGGGIASTVRATRTASDEVLRSLARVRLDRFLDFGVTTLEAKSGYGLSLQDELRLLQVYHDVAPAHPVEIVPTLLAAHVVPVEYTDRVQDYVDLVVKDIIPAAAERKLARFCDAFCERGAFNVEQCRTVLEAGLEYGLRPKLHSEQLTYTGGTTMAAELGAASVDHLDHASEASIIALADVSRLRGAPTAVLLPGAAFFLASGAQHAPARQMLDRGVRVALSTDFNPGTSPTQNLWLMTTMGCSYMRMSADEVIRAITIEAAAALDLSSEVGSLEVGKKADILILEHSREAEIPYSFGTNPVWQVFKNGKRVVQREIMQRDCIFDGDLR
jgi:imidazolonepropionase